MEIDEEYTKNDHELRSSDSYAALKYRLTIRWLGQARGTKLGHLLNIGCGAGDFNALAQDAGYVVDGIEPDLKALDIAKSRSLPNAKLEACSIFEFESIYSYDVIVMHDVLEHIEDDDKAVKKVHSLLVDDDKSIFLLSVPAHQSLFGFHDEQLGHFRRYNKRNLKKLLHPYFVVRKSRYVGLMGIPAAIYYSKLQRKPYPIDGGGFGRMVFDAICSLEYYIHLGTGSSIMLLCTPRRANPQI